MSFARKQQQTSITGQTRLTVPNKTHGMVLLLRDYSISAEEERRLQNRINDFEEETKSRNATHLTLITTFGLKANSHSSEINNVVLMDDLFT